MSHLPKHVLSPLLQLLGAVRAVQCNAQLMALHGPSTMPA